MIRTMTALLSVTALSVGLTAQSNAEKYEKKLAKDFVAKASWAKTLKAAKAQAAKESKLIFGYFTRSYAP